MQLNVGDRIEVESESTDRPPRTIAPAGATRCSTGVIEEVVREAPSARYRIRWDDGHESIYTPAAGALRHVEPAEQGH